MMVLAYLQNQQARSLFLEAFLEAIGKTDDRVLSAEQTTELRSIQAAYEEACERRTQDLAEKTRRVKKRKEVLHSLYLLNRQTVDTIRMMIRRGIYPPTVPAHFKLPMTGRGPSRAMNKQISIAAFLIQGDAGLAQTGLRRLINPSAGEIEAAMEAARRENELLTQAKARLQQSRMDVKRLEGRIDKIYTMGQKALELISLDLSRSERRELKRNFGYRFRSRG